MICADPEMIVQSVMLALETLAADEDRCSMMACNAYDAAMEFDRNVQYQKFVDLIERVQANSQ